MGGARISMTSSQRGLRVLGTMDKELERYMRCKDCSQAEVISLTLTFACNALSISSLGPDCEEARPCRSKVRPESHLPMQEPSSASVHTSGD
jgi:hypothetical protein